jgi:putative ABC transport system permease protein
MIDSVRQDVRFALRGLRRRPGFTALVVLTLALGIGANSAIFSVVNGVLLRPLPYQRPGEIATLWMRWPSNQHGELSQPEYWDLTEQSRSFTRLAAYANGSLTLTGSGQPERLNAGAVSAGLLPLLGVAPALGRAFSPEDDQPGRPVVVLLSDGLWRRRFGADRHVIGRSLRLDDAPATVIGVMPPGFQLPTDYTGPGMDLWAPLQLDPAVDRSERGWHWVRVVGRLRPGVDIAAASREVTVLATRMRETYPGEYKSAFSGFAVTAAEDLVGDVRPAILVLLGAVGLLLLIACANVASLLLARAEARQREVAVRTALGAGAGRMVRQLLTESLVLAGAGGVLGLLLADWGVRVLIATAPPTLPRLDAIETDGWVLGFTLLVTTATGVLFGLLPALQAARPDLTVALAEGGRSGASAGRQRFRRGLVVAQIALAVVLVSTAGLLLRSFERLRGVDPGFDPGGLLTAQVELSPVRYDSAAKIRAFYDQLVPALERLPGVQSAAAVRALPMTGRLEIGDWSFVVEGRHSTPPTPADRINADWQSLTPNYFRTLRIPVLQGRAFEDADRHGGQEVVLVNRTLARTAWPDGNVVGQRILLGGGGVDSVWRTVVGIVGDVRHRGLSADPRPEMYLPYDQFPAGTGTPNRTMRLVLRTGGDPAALAPGLRAAVAALDPDLPVTEVQTMESALGAWAAERRLTMVLVAGFAVLALTLGAVGVYGVMAHLVVQRTREIGVRIALGAAPGAILGLVLSQGAWLAGAGIGLGLLAALAASRLLTSLLFDVAPTDPPTYLVTVAALLAVAAAAAVIPARRATRTDPVEALRSE